MEGVDERPGHSDDKQQLRARLRRIEGQVRGLDRRFTPTG